MIVQFTIYIVHTRQSYIVHESICLVLFARHASFARNALTQKQFYSLLHNTSERFQFYIVIVCICFLKGQLTIGNGYIMLIDRWSDSRDVEMHIHA